jgi:hypothetical protein
MGVWDKLRNSGNYVFKRWKSARRGSYEQYRMGRERERKSEERGRQNAERSSERERKEEQQGREYEERYAAERAAAEPRTQTTRRDMRTPE